LDALPRVIHRVRRLFDLGADVAGIAAHLSSDPWLAPLVAARPGLRVPGAWDGFELAVRALLGQQVSVPAARQLLGRLVEVCGAPAPLPAPSPGLFPPPERVARGPLARLGTPAARAAALRALAGAALAEPRLFEPLGTLEETVARLRALRGV